MERYVTCADRTRVFVRDQGTGMPVVLLHGFPLDGSMWDAQRRQLGADYRVIVPDLRGFGRSGVTPGTVSMARMADDVAQLLEQLQVDGPVVLAGLSMGGYIAWQFWRRHLQQLAALVLVNTRADADAPEAARGRLMTANRLLEEGTDAVAQSMAQRVLGRATQSQSPELVSRWRECMRRQPAEGMAAALRGMAERDDFTARLPEVNVPALVVAGQQDVITPAESMRKMAARLPRATYVEIAGAGHLTPVEQAGEVTRALQVFFTTLPAAGR